ncbi:hypothetical protein FA039_20415 [Escherichia coli]|nr:hypothetical protein [Escherichia coli]
MMNDNKNGGLSAGAGTRSTITSKSAESGLSPLARELGAVFTVHCANLGLSRWRGNSNIPGDNQPAYSVYPAGAGTRERGRFRQGVHGLSRWRGNSQ